MRVVVTVFPDKSNALFERFTANVTDEGYIEQVSQDIKDFIGEQYFEMTEDSI